MARPEVQGDHEIIDLSSDVEDDIDVANALGWHDDLMGQEADDAWVADFDNMIQGYGQDEASVANDPDTIDLTAIPDIDVPPSDHHVIDGGSPQPNAKARDSDDDSGMIMTEAACLQMVLNVFPDISVEHALKIISDKTTDATRTVERCGRLITELLDGGGYPKEADEASSKKRKRGAEDSLSDYERDERDPEIMGYEQDALELLRDEFLSVPIRHLTNTLKKEKTLFKAFGVLEEQLQTYRQVATPFNKIGTPRNKRGAELILIERGSQIPKELHAAKRRKEIIAGKFNTLSFRGRAGSMVAEAPCTKRQQAKEADQAEEMNLQQAQAENQMGECACCFDDVPLNRMISCNGHTAHFYCINCPRMQIETMMGQSRCRPTCFGVTNCPGTFSRTQLQQVLSEKTFERLEHMQQLEDIKAAKLDFLSECPFCDFKMECPPVEVDKEFRCENKKCGKTSCRLCDKETHIPLSCEEAKKDGTLTYRHIIEEAMSKALIRQCNQCKQPFVKEMGCNKMTCSHCRNVQCYVCSKNVTDYNHFGDTRRSKCPLHDNIEERHEQEVTRAADEARNKLRAENPDLSEADLMVQVSDQVKQVEQQRKGRAAAEVDVFPYHMVGDQLQNRAPPAGQADIGAAARMQQHLGLIVDQQLQQNARLGGLFPPPPPQIARPPRALGHVVPGFLPRARNYGPGGLPAERGDAPVAQAAPAARPAPPNVNRDEGLGLGGRLHR
ncbi:hypothetical protein NX059_006747 [Plenodomus lindquistii]|nr:hypothetical protein NX059_006747 [Plenodomus lindquistii]